MKESLMEQPFVRPTDQKSEHRLNAQEEVKKIFSDFAAAIRSGKLDEIMDFYDRSIVAFDMMPPLQFIGLNKYQKSWDECFTSYFEFPVQFEYVEQNIEVADDIAFSHSLVHMSGAAKKDGEKMEAWMRNTTCLKKLDGAWKITHEHNSVPLELETGKGMMNLKPHELAH